jgi:hypothetical protein
VHTDKSVVNSRSVRQHYVGPSGGSKSDLVVTMSKLWQLKRRPAFTWSDCSHPLMLIRINWPLAWSARKDPDCKHFKTVSCKIRLVRGNYLKRYHKKLKNFSCSIKHNCVGLTTGWTIGVRSPVGAEDFSSSLCVQTSSGAHPASYPMGFFIPS